MTKGELLIEMAKDTGLTKRDCEAVLDATLTSRKYNTKTENNQSIVLIGSSYITL